MPNCNIVTNLHRREISYNRFYSSPLSSSNQIVRSFFGLSDSLYKTDLYFHTGCVNSVKFSNDGLYMVSGNKLDLPRRFFILITHLSLAY